MLKNFTLPPSVNLIHCRNVLNDFVGDLFCILQIR